MPPVKSRHDYFVFFNARQSDVATTLIISHTKELESRQMNYNMYGLHVQRENVSALGLTIPQSWLTQTNAFVGPGYAYLHSDTNKIIAWNHVNYSV